MRSITHPGTPNAQRFSSVVTEVCAFNALTRTQVSLLDAIADIADKQNVQSGAFRLNGGALTSFNYVMPALSTSSAHAVYFSETFYVAGTVQLETACVTYGRRDGAPWLHCHAVWVEPSGRRHCGHLLPDQIVVSAPISVSGVSLNDATFSVTPDAETRFSLFIPHPSQNIPVSRAAPAQAFGVGHALRLAPNQDICLSIEQFCLDNHIKSAQIYGGVGSTVGAVFDDGRVVEPFVTELLIRSGHISLDRDGNPSAAIDIVIVDHLGGVSEGRLAKGENPVLVTAELVIVQLS